ncbi:hypothetical protein H6CHR_01641 [Variovorax sp. PBL-H6]|uniref:hypothetical protein n=1 Tax=Variovorax sp. PBL-H6 TaxID=434009 RepID=UPI00131724FB|nr:hypothetical protein [Variovorax sp. PBL-H6]VTU21695.1 hypothetical protein H6CHR_01641 [Variovorax sp. PBL-H6]
MSRLEMAGAVLLALSLAGLWIEPRMFLASWLAAWWWCLGLVLGCFINAWMHALTGGAWGHPIRAAAVLLARRMPWLLLGLVPVAAGLAVLYPWAADPRGAWLDEISRPAFLKAWLSAPFFLARLVVYALVWWCLARAGSLASKGRAAAALVAYALVTSLAAVDLLMSLQPRWYSTAFGLIALTAQALSGAALAVLLTALGAPGRWPSRAAAGVPLWRDLGNLLLMWVMTWAYVAFMQFLIIWAENLPREIAWYVPRLQTGWVCVAVALVLLQLVLPFLVLLFRSIKDRPRRLAGVAALMLAASALDAAWTVLPSVDAHSLHGWWLAPLAFAGMSLLLFAGMPERLRRGAPEADSPRMEHAGP